MIEYNEKLRCYHLQTKSTSYIIHILGKGYVENLYYGKKINSVNDESINALLEKNGTGYGNSVVCPEDATCTLDSVSLEYSFEGTGDYRNLPIQIVMPGGETSAEFISTGYTTYKGIFKQCNTTGMPYAHAGINDEAIETLEIITKDTKTGIICKLVYTVYEKCDVITRRVVIDNVSNSAIKINKIMSMQLDLPDKHYRMYTYDGMWARERMQHIKQLESGIFVNASTTGSSSNRHNPYIMLEKNKGREAFKSCYAFNLIYSGNHYEAVEVSGYDKLRIMSGINPDKFEWTLDKETEFVTPEAIMSYSNEGVEMLSQTMHRFINTHIIANRWQGKERPVLINNWEATYFDFNEARLMKLARAAKEVGIELFVLDDGWFGDRNTDKTSLGDWNANERKLGGSLATFSRKIEELGMKFGLWFEPEMISEESELYKAHPDWAVKVPQRTTYTGRNQLFLDLTRTEVRDYVVDIVNKNIKEAHISYVKWDMNRHLTDAYSLGLGSRQGEFSHRYILGLYDLFERIVEENPEVLFEGCSSGGNRFDLGILYYMPQIWTSDDTDANERIDIQQGTAAGYPLSTMGAHVSAVPNHQTLRNTSLETRFNVACFGALGYELDVTRLTKAEKKIVINQIEFYKEYRKVFLYGDFYYEELDDGSIVWQVVSSDKNVSVLMLYQRLARVNSAHAVIRFAGLDKDAEYEITNRPQSISVKQFGELVNQVTPVHITEAGVLQSIINKVYMLDS